MAASAAASLCCAVLLVAGASLAAASPTPPDAAAAAPTAEQLDAFRSALSDYDAGRFDDARRTFEILAESTLDRAGVWFWLARAARAVGDLALAEKA